MNRLSEEKAAYLRHAAYQRIDWYPWCEEAFERARQEDKPVFLSSGAIWCHWCHVMAKECFDDDDVIRLLNENCINIKLDRDERPDIDRVYQQAVAAMGSGGGWPLSVFLAPDKKPFFGGTYFPLEDNYGRPGFKKIIRGVIEFYKSKRADVVEYSHNLTDFLQPKQTPPGVLSESVLFEAVTAILEEFDPQNGGFGTSPKFPMAGAIEFLINRYFLMINEGDAKRGMQFPLESAGLTIKKTLMSMAKGGFHDHLGGGFHRYSTDEGWHVPHFEKMADDNAWLLRNYVDAWSLFGDEYFREISFDIIKFLREVLSDREGGFYASQDADVTPDDEGGYFTWTEEDFRRVLSEEEYAVLSRHLFHEKGTMHHDTTKRVLFTAVETEDIAAEMGMEVEVIDGIIRRGKERLLQDRFMRKPPLVDTTLYTSLNGMLISAYLKAYRGLGDNYVKEFALKSLDRIMKLRFIDGELYHAEGVKALLEDYVHIMDSHISAYEVTGEQVYLDRAVELMEKCLSVLWDETGGALFDSPDGHAGVRLKGGEDIPHPSANSLAVICLLKLSFITGRDAYYRYAETSLKASFLRAKDMGIHSAYYYCALDEYFNMIKLTLETAPHSDLAEAARSTFNPYVTIAYGDDRGFATPCRRGSCYESIYDADGLRAFLKRLP
ncbi:MAG TPA: thioredoxin domain-containing protein [Thermodesulfovibrionales bacterium]|nr:thioredoxin domain-containing protein [Thermodesulfovibrionales bacterium]